MNNSAAENPTTQQMFAPCCRVILRSFRSLFYSLFVGVFFSLLVGCQAPTKMYVWQVGPNYSAEVKSIAIGPIEGSKTTGDLIEEAIGSQRPLWQEKLAVIFPSQMHVDSSVRLASTAPPIAQQGDIGALYAARSAGADLLLTGEVVRDELESIDPTSQQLPPELAAWQNSSRMVGQWGLQRPEHLTVHWKCVDVKTGETVDHFTVSTDRNRADVDYPELVWSEPMAQRRVAAAIGRETWKSLGPHVSVGRINASVTWGLPGSSKNRGAILLAKSGNWQEAEEQWQELVEAYPWQHAAWHNLALAAAAREDFPEARRRIKKAMSLWSSRHYESSFQWIEMKQRDYHRALGLGDPEGGWAFPEPQRSTFLAVGEARPRDLDELPWWTAIPFTKPPGWTWRAWLTQPWAL